MRQKQLERRAYETWRDQKTEISWIAFRDTRRERKSLVKRVKKELLRRKVRDIEELKTHDPREYWRRLKGLSPPLLPVE